MPTKRATQSYVYVQPIYEVVERDMQSLNDLYDQILAHRHTKSNKVFRKTKTGRQLIASIVRGLNTYRRSNDGEEAKVVYRISIDQGQRSLDWRKYPNATDSQSVRLILDPMLELGWLERTRGDYGHKISDMFFAPEGSPLRVQWSFKRLDYTPPKVVINFNTKRDERDGGYRSPDIDKMQSPRFKKPLQNHFIPQIEHLSKLINSHSYNLPFTDYQIRRGFVGGLEECGGRLQANYQLLSEKERLGILIDNQPVSEIDVVSCGLVLLHSLAKQPLPDVDDLYSLVESSLTRKELKHLITSLCNSKNHVASKNWSTKFKADRKLGVIVAKTNYKQFCNSLLSAFPWLEKFLTETDDLALKTQWLESEAIIKSMFTVLNAGHGCLSVHESLIVPKDTEGLAMLAMTEAFQEVAGVRPKLVAK